MTKKRIEAVEGKKIKRREGKWSLWQKKKKEQKLHVKKQTNTENVKRDTKWRTKKNKKTKREKYSLSKIKTNLKRHRLT